MIKMNQKDFDQIVESIAESIFLEYRDSVLLKVREWRSIDNRPAVVNEPPAEFSPSIIDPKSETQVSDENMPIADSKWTPGNKSELGRALKQMADSVPDDKVEWAYLKIRTIIDKSIDSEDEGRMRPRLGNDVQ